MAGTARTRRRSGPKSPVRAATGRAAAGAGIIALGWLVVASGFANVARNARPDEVLSAFPVDAGANVRKSELALAGGLTKQSAVEAARWSRAALERDPTSVAAWRNLGLTSLMLDRARQGYRLLAFAERLSRRDTGTQLALLERAVQKGDIAGALAHYDLVFRVSPSQDALLMPILVAASEDPEIRPKLVTMVRNAPGWRRRFFSALLASPPAPGAAATLVEQLAAANALSDRDIIGTLAYNFGLSGQDAAAWRIYAALKPGRAVALRNGGFEDPAPLAPFDWLPESAGPVSAAVSDQGDGHRMELTSSRGDVGPGLRQLLALRPGHFRLQFQAGAIEGYAAPVLYWQLRCGSDGALLIRGSGAPARTGVSFKVPAASCAGQWLEFGFQTVGGDDSAAVWLDQVAVSPLH